MRNITFNMSNFHQYGTAFYDYLALRKHFFVDQLKWDIPHDDQVEMDQYDNPLAQYSLVLQEGKLIGGARVMPTTSKWGEHTYMLRDAQSGKLGTIPEDVLPEIIATPRVWECTRLVVSESIRSLHDRAKCLDLIVDGLSRMARENGATELIALTRPTLVRSLRGIGYDCVQIGKSYFNEDDGRKYAVLSMPVNKMAQPMAA